MASVKTDANLEIISGIHIFEDMKQMMDRLFAGILLILIISMVSICFTIPGTSREADTLNIELYKAVNKYALANERCFSCHAETRYQLTDESTGHVINRLMDQGKIILRDEFYRSNHKHFACTKCHSGRFEEFPHLITRREAGLPGCLDCHGQDETDPLDFNQINEEFLQSIHLKANPDRFNCWKCHDPHLYAIGFRTAEIMKEAISYDNEICLSCHGNPDRFKKYTDREPAEMSDQHEWLPNQGLHFNHVRCIDCHTRVNDDILVAHLILPEDEAVRNCNKCHSTSSLLMATLFKYQAEESRSKYGFMNSMIMNDAYVIGANKNVLLNKITLTLFSLAFISIAIHILLRIIKKI
jgi:Zn finger protein HypA/HybF involved in hydrogenase expression